jgi:Integrase core domain
VAGHQQPRSFARHRGTCDYILAQEGSSFFQDIQNYAPKGEDLVATVALERAEITISRDGPGRVSANLFVEHLGRRVKYGYIYLKDYANVPTLEAGLEPDFSFYSHERPHQSLAYWMPTAVHLEHDRYGAKHPPYFSHFPVLTGRPITKSLESTLLKIDKNTY